MKIDSDLIKNKNYTIPISPSILKHSQEYNVLASLRYLFPHKFESMVTGESPDLQDIVNGIGIEVTAAVRENDMKASRAFASLRKGDNKSIEKNKTIIDSSGYSIMPIREDKVAISTLGTSNGEKNFFQESIQRKIKKFQRYKTYFKKIGLAVILPEIPTSYFENHICEWISEMFNENSESFDFVYVISHRFCIYYDVRTKVSDKWSITNEEHQLLSTVARMTAEGELSLNSTEWI